MLNHLKQDEDVQKANDSIGGGALESNIYPFTVKAAYMGTSASGAVSVTFVGSVDDKSDEGYDFRTVQWVVSGDAKGNNPYYERNGKKFPLPGFTVADDFARHITEKAIGDLETEEKTIKVYNFDQGKEIDTEVDMIVNLIGGKVNLAIQQRLVNKNVKDDATGAYVPTADTRTEYEVSKVLEMDTGLSILELEKGSTDTDYANKWPKKKIGRAHV